MLRIGIVLAMSLSTLLAGCAISPSSAYKEGVRQEEILLKGQKPSKDPIYYFQYAAEKEVSPQLQGKYYDRLGDALKRRGKISKAYTAYEAGAVIGNEASGNEIYKAHLAGKYRPKNLSQIATNVYIPRAKGPRGQSAALFLADLVGSGELTGKKFQTSVYWLKKAAASGSARAVRLLAEDEVRRGRVRTAAAYYARIDNKPPKFRALSEARKNFLGQDRELNRELGISWLMYAQTLARSDTAVLAAKLFRSTGGKYYNEELERLAAAGGIMDLRSTGSKNRGRKKVSSGVGPYTALVTAYSSAVDDDQKKKVLSALIAKADGGDGASAFLLARVLQTDGGFGGYKSGPYYVTSLEKNNLEAISSVADTIAVLEPGNPLVTRILKAMERVASKGNSEALKTLGALYIVGGPVGIDYDKGVAYLKKAADGGDVDASYRLGVLMIQNAQGPDDKKMGQSYLEKASKKGNAAAKQFLTENSPSNP